MKLNEPRRQKLGKVTITIIIIIIIIIIIMIIIIITIILNVLMVTFIPIFPNQAKGSLPWCSKQAPFTTGNN